MTNVNQAPLPRLSKAPLVRASLVKRRYIKYLALPFTLQYRNKTTQMRRNALIHCLTRTSWSVSWTCHWREHRSLLLSSAKWKDSDCSLNKLYCHWGKRDMRFGHIIRYFGKDFHNSHSTGTHWKEKINLLRNLWLVRTYTVLLHDSVTDMHCHMAQKM